MQSKLKSALDDLRQRLSGSVVAIGNFDGVHLGHRALVTRACADAQARGLTSLALTFEPHPQTYFRRSDASSFRLTDPAHKRRILLGLGVDDVIALPFGSVAELTSERFVREVLSDGLKANAVWVGGDFHFGRGRTGTTATLVELLGDACVTNIHAPVELEGEVVSSSRTREALTRGDLDLASQLMDRDHSLVGEVVKGDARGRTLGFPTLNICPAAGMMVPWGVYVTSVGVVGESGGFQSITNVGVRPTVGKEEAATAETFVLAADGVELDWYGKEVEVTLHRFIRPERKFGSFDGLRKQIELDVEAASRFHDKRV